MKYILSVIVVMLSIGTRAQAVRITVNEKKAETIQPLSNTKFEIVFNDSIVVELVSGSDGALGKIPLDEGTYTIVLKNEAFEPAIEKNVKLSPGKITPLTVNCKRKK